MTTFRKSSNYVAAPTKIELIFENVVFPNSKLLIYQKWWLWEEQIFRDKMFAPFPYAQTKLITYQLLSPIIVSRSLFHSIQNLTKFQSYTSFHSSQLRNFYKMKTRTNCKWFIMPYYLLACMQRGQSLKIRYKNFDYIFARFFSDCW